LFDKDLAKARSVIKAVSVSDHETIETIKKIYAETGYLLDPHSAVGWRASDMLGETDDIVVATASPLKFAEEIEQKTGIKVDNEHLLAVLRRQPERYVSIRNSFQQLADYLMSLS